MLKRFAIHLLAALIFPFVMAAQNPVLTSVSPSKFYTQSEPTVLKLTIEGKNMWPDYLTITMTIQVMHVHFKKAGRDEEIRGVGISSDKQIVEFISSGWLNTPGDIEVYVTIDEFSGRPAFRSNSLFLHVEETPKTAPVLSSISSSSFTVGAPKDKYYIRLYGKNFGEQKSTFATIGGVSAPAGWEHLEDGVMDVWVPSAIYTKAGSYPVVVHTKYGESNPVTLTMNPMVITMVPQKKSMPVQTNVNNNGVISTLAKGIMQPNKDAFLKADMVKGIRVTLTGIISDGATRTALENYISSLANVFVVDNQLDIAEASGNINIVLKAAGVDKPAVEAVRKQIQDKAAAMGLHASVL